MFYFLSPSLELFKPLYKRLELLKLLVVLFCFNEFFIHVMWQKAISNKLYEVLLLLLLSLSPVNRT